MKKNILFFSLILFITPSFSQEEETDSLKQLDEVFIRAFEQNRHASLTTATVKVIDRNATEMNNKSSFVNALNTIAGVRMEERSPGSYRINIRGSSLRSPFGVRNVKVYWNDIPLTDPGGNTYFNQLAQNNFSIIEVFKGPAGSMYGAGTGGLILINNLDRWQPGASLEYIAGSYNLQNVFASARFGQKENKNQFTFAHNQSDGYRVQSKMRRDNFSWMSHLKLSAKQQLTASVLFSDMYYQTPGALTLAEYNTNPTSARPAAGGFPSAATAKAAIWQKNITTGFTNFYQFNTAFTNTTTIYGTFNQVKNAAIRNFERRNEPHVGGRSVFNYIIKKKETTWQLTAGTEYQSGFFNTQVAKNRNGNPDTLQTNDDIRYTTYNFFGQADTRINNTWSINGGISINKTKVNFIRLSTYPVTEQKRSYQNEIAPRISLKKDLRCELSLRVAMSRGFSPPTISELLPSTGVISTNLEAENGWNYEMTVTKFFFRKKLQLELTGFYFYLNNALVQRRDISGADYFINAGDVKQKGLEAHSSYLLIAKNKSLVDYLNLRADYTYSHFRYGSFIRGIDNYSGKIVPSVPANIFSFTSDLQLKNGIYTNITFYAASEIFLNDANSAKAEPYQLMGARIGWSKRLEKKYKLNLYTGVDNLLDEKYSLGNDINAAANRFYNAAPQRNYYAGISFQWIKAVKK